MLVDYLQTALPLTCNSSGGSWSTAGGFEFAFPTVDEVEVLTDFSGAATGSFLAHYVEHGSFSRSISADSVVLFSTNQKSSAPITQSSEPFGRRVSLEEVEQAIASDCRKFSSEVGIFSLIFSIAERQCDQIAHTTPN